MWSTDNSVFLHGVSLHYVYFGCDVLMNASRSPGPLVTETTNTHECSIYILTLFSEHLYDYEKTHTIFFSKNCGKHQSSVFVSDTSRIQTCLLQQFSEDLHCKICFGTMEDISIITLRLGPIVSCITTLL